MMYIIHVYLIQEIDEVAVGKACQEIFAGNFITLGISIVAIAVSVLIGLNINISIEKGELSTRIEDLAKQNQKQMIEHRQSLQKFEEK